MANWNDIALGALYGLGGFAQGAESGYQNQTKSLADQADKKRSTAIEDFNLGIQLGDSDLATSALTDLGSSDPIFKQSNLTPGGKNSQQLLRDSVRRLIAQNHLKDTLGVLKTEGINYGDTVPMPTAPQAAQAKLPPPSPLAPRPPVPQAAGMAPKPPIAGVPAPVPQAAGMAPKPPIAGVPAPVPQAAGMTPKPPIPGMASRPIAGVPAPAPKLPISAGAASPVPDSQGAAPASPEQIGGWPIPGTGRMVPYPDASTRGLLDEKARRAGLPPVQWGSFKTPEEYLSYRNMLLQAKDLPEDAQPASEAVKTALEQSFIKAGRPDLANATKNAKTNGDMRRLALLMPKPGERSISPGYREFLISAANSQHLPQLAQAIKADTNLSQVVSQNYWKAITTNMSENDKKRLLGLRLQEFAATKGYRADTLAQGAQRLSVDMQRLHLEAGRAASSNKKDQFARIIASYKPRFAIAEAKVKSTGTLLDKATTLLVKIAANNNIGDPMSSTEPIILPARTAYQAAVRGAAAAQKELDGAMEDFEADTELFNGPPPAAPKPIATPPHRVMNGQ